MDRVTNAFKRQARHPLCQPSWHHQIIITGLDYKKNLVGQGYNGAAVMHGAHAGVQAKRKEVAKHAFYVHSSAL